MWATSECQYIKRVLQNVSSRPPNFGTSNIVARAEAKTLLEARCAGFMDNEVDSAAISRKLHESGEFTSDPLLTIQTQLYAENYEKNSNSRKLMLSDALEAQDPYLWSRLAPTFIRIDKNTHQLYFDGQFYAGIEANHLLMARDLVICGIGIACEARHDTLVAVSCYQDNICEHDRFELMKKQAEMRKYNFALIMSFYNKLLDAFKAKRISAFVAA